MTFGRPCRCDAFPTRRVALAAGLAAVLPACADPGANATPPPRTRPGAPADTPPDTMAARLVRLVAAYPDHLARLDGDALVWRDGTRTPTGASRPERPFDVMLRDATVADMLRQTYAPGPITSPPPRDHSPGRIRDMDFFARIYGDCRAAPPPTRPVTWMPRTGAPGGPQRLPVTTVNDVASRLERVIESLERLPDRFKAFLIPSAGTLNCRPVADTGLPSMHGTGAAIDLNASRSDYWHWARGRSASGGTDIPYRNRIPGEIAECFEAERFIWGAKWYHYDTMHFEYRPELFPA